jgi:hypothetical protein
MRCHSRLAVFAAIKIQPIGMLESIPTLCRTSSGHALQSDRGKLLGYAILSGSEESLYFRFKNAGIPRSLRSLRMTVPLVAVTRPRCTTPFRIVRFWDSGVRWRTRPKVSKVKAKSPKFSNRETAGASKKIHARGRTTSHRMPFRNITMRRALYPTGSVC